jgi:hypothetical protein
MQTNTYNVKKTRILLQTTWDKDEPHIVYNEDIVTDNNELKT